MEGDSYCTNLMPRLNMRVNNLVFYAQGTSSIKMKAQERDIAGYFLEDDGIHFKGNCHLKI